jgi:hypothetical protein
LTRSNRSLPSGWKEISEAGEGWEWRASRVLERWEVFKYCSDARGVMILVLVSSPRIRKCREHLNAVFEKNHGFDSDLDALLSSQ